jgi:hypothetical protein
MPTPDPTQSPEDPAAPDTTEPAPPAPPAPPVPSAPATGEVRVSVGYPVSVFVHHVDGVPHLTDVPQAVPASSLPALREAALSSEVDLIEEQS